MDGENKARRIKYAGYLLCVLCFSLTIWAFYPGLMSPDSVGNLADGRSGSFHDVNAPVMSWLWGLLDKIITGPALMLVLQNAIFWSGCAIFWQVTHKKSAGLGLCLILFALFPQILSQLPVIWKDVGLGASLFLSTALLYFADKTKSRLALSASVPFLFYASAVRLNALPAVLPIAVWSGFIFCRVFETGKTKRVRVLAGIVYFAALSAAVFVVNDQLTGGQTIYPSQQIYLYDLAAISKERNEAMFPEYILQSEKFSLETVKMRYNERSVSDLIFPDVPNVGDLPPLKLASDPAEVAVLKEKWRTVVSENPLAYLKHRGKVFARLTGLSSSVTRPFWDLGFAGNPAEFRREENFAGKILMKYFGAFGRPFSQTFFFRVVLWLLLCGYFLYQSFKRKFKDDWELVFVLSISCLLFTFAYFPTTPSTEFRYLFWSAVSSTIVVIFGIYHSAQTEDNLIGKTLSRFRK